MNTDMSRQTRTVFVFRNLLEVWWPTVKNDTFFCCCFSKHLLEGILLFSQLAGVQNLSFLVDRLVPFRVSVHFCEAFLGYGTPKPTPTQSFCQQKIPTSKPKDQRKFRRPMLRSWNKWKPCIASSKPINPRWALLGFTFSVLLVLGNVFFFWGGVWWNSKDVGVGRLYGQCVCFFSFFSRGDRCVWFKKWLKKDCFWS